MLCFYNVGYYIFFIQHFSTQLLKESYIFVFIENVSHILQLPHEIMLDQVLTLKIVKQLKAQHCLLHHALEQTIYFSKF